MQNVIKCFWFKTNGEIVDLSKIREDDDLFLKKYWYKSYKIVDLIKFGKTYQLSIKKGGRDNGDFESIYIDFKDKKQLECFLRGLMKDVK